MDIGDIFGIEFGQTNPETKQAEVIFPIRSPYRYDKVYDLDTVMLHIRTGSEHKKFTLRVKGLDYPVSYNPDGGGYFFLHNGSNTH
jgi:hypothetical protein